MSGRSQSPTIFLPGAWRYGLIYFGEALRSKEGSHLTPLQPSEVKAAYELAFPAGSY
jgi:hypothetical protein